MAPRSNKSPELRPPGAVLEITRALESAGFQAWCVGGAIRDALLGHPHLDWDFATDATPDQVRTLFGRKRTIPVGVEFGTVGVLDGEGVLHEITTFRRDVRTDGRHAEVEFGASLDEDLARRDFTVNAIAYSPSRGVLHDPFDGRSDLDRRVIRAVGEPAARMREDRLRALRAIRFAARFGFEIERETWTAIRESASYLTRLSAERVKQELEKTMDQVASPSRAMRLWSQSGAFDTLVPELAAVDERVLRALDSTPLPGLSRRPARRLTRFAILLSDLPASAVPQLGTRLRFSNDDTRWIATLVERWQTVGPGMSTMLQSGAADARSIRRWVAAIGRLHLGGYYRVAAARWAADHDAGGRGPSARAVHSAYRRSLRAALSEPVDLRDLAIDGDDLRQAGISPGPEMGTILSALLELVIDDPRLNARDRLLEEAQRLHAGGGAPERNTESDS